MTFMRTDEAAGGEIDAARIERLLGEIGERLRAPKEDLVAEIEAHLTDLVGLDIGEALRAVARAQRINRVDDARLARCHKSALALLAYVLYQARTQGGAPDR